jgi:hypothetical protein
MQHVQYDKFITHGTNVTQIGRKQFNVSEAYSNNQQNPCLPVKVKITLKKQKLIL